LEDASKWIRNDPGMAKSWVYRKNKNTNEIMWNFLPLHSACFAHAPIAVVKELIRVHPQSVYITAPGDKLPIHIACETAASPDVVTCLVSAYPEALYHLDVTGNTPLQLCVFSMIGKNRSKGRF
jgi:ankyrin repeat protein